jgi:hypothetical protein
MFAGCMKIPDACIPDNQEFTAQKKLVVIALTSRVYVVLL